LLYNTTAPYGSPLKNILRQRDGYVEKLIVIRKNFFYLLYIKRFKIQFFYIKKLISKLPLYGGNCPYAIDGKVNVFAAAPDKKFKVQYVESGETLFQNVYAKILNCYMKCKKFYVENITKYSICYYVRIDYESEKFKINLPLAIYFIKERFSFLIKIKKAYKSYIDNF